MKIFIEKREVWIERNFEGKIEDLLRELKINPETIVITKNDELVTQDDEVSNKDEVKLLSVISGG